MEQVQNENVAPLGPISDGVAIKKMRLLRRLSRKEATLLFSYSRSSIEKIENGRAKLTAERVRKFIEGYGFTQNQFMELKIGKKLQGFEVQSETKKISILERNDLRRSYKKIVTNEVRVLVALRRRKGVSQYGASRLCSYSRPTIGHIEQGRIELTEARIKHIVECYDFSLKEFYEALRSDIRRDEVEAECVKLIQKLDDNKIMAIKGILERF